MGIAYQVKCECSYERLVTVGGNRNTYQTESPFPFFCQTCGLVNVNTIGSNLNCPKCDSKEIKPYGDPSISKKLDSVNVHQSDYQIQKNHNLCPSCLKYTMEFNLYMIID